MFSWFGFSLLSAFSESLTSIVDKVSLDKFLKNAYLAVVFEGFFSLVIAAIIWLFFGPFSFIVSFPILISVFAGLCETAGTVLYYRSMKLEEASKVIALLQLIPVFVTVLAILFLHQSFSFNQFLGILFLVMGAFLISLKKLEFKFTVTSVLRIMLLSAFSFAVSKVVLDYALVSLSFSECFFYFLLGFGLSSLLFAFTKNSQIAFKQAFAEFGWKPFAFFFFGQTFFYIGIFLEFISLSLGDSPLVSALRALRAFFTFGLAIVLTIFLPRFLQEDIRSFALSQKVLAIVLIVAGAFLIR
ncbi:MAG: EamA family transporter [Candidatus Diapherotrites archaeon]|nr:EamA family transporter [Candidatus Diapherotrites archaeon]